MAEGSNFMVMVELATPGTGTLDCAVVVTLVTATGSAVGKHNKHYMVDNTCLSMHQSTLSF